MSEVGLAYRPRPSETGTASSSRHPGSLQLLSSFEPISLAEMDQVALLDRTDTKFVLTQQQLLLALGDSEEHYRVLEVQGNRLVRYRTLYFDTDEFELYRHHHSGKRVRYKVRSREYIDTNLSFLEVKRKGKRGRTVKDRVRTTNFVTEWDPDAAESMGSRLLGQARHLEPRVSVEFYRVTLASKHHKERVTLDLDLRFQGCGNAVALSGLVVAEVKQETLSRGSAFFRQMRGLGIRPGAFSKYCIGVCLLHQDVKHNRFKPRLRLIDKLMGDSGNA